MNQKEFEKELNKLLEKINYKFSHYTFHNFGSEKYELEIKALPTEDFPEIKAAMDIYEDVTRRSKEDEDIKYFRDSLFRALKVPKKYKK